MQCSYTPETPESQQKIEMVLDGHTVKLYQKAISLVLDILEQEQLRGYVSRLPQLSELKDDSEKFILNNVHSGYHLIGGHVVDHDSLLRHDFSWNGEQNLFSADASCFDRFVASNVEVPTVALASSWAKNNLGEVLGY